MFCRFCPTSRTLFLFFWVNCQVNAFYLSDFLKICKNFGGNVDNYDVLPEFIEYFWYILVTSAMLWLIFCGFCPFLMVLSRIMLCLRLCFTGFTQLLEHYLRFVGFFLGYYFSFTGFHYDLRDLGRVLLRFMACWSNFSSVFTTF